MACRGGVSQEAHEGYAISGAPATASAATTTPARDAEPMASEVDVPWSIALLSDGEPRAGELPPVIVVDRAPAAEDPAAEEEAEDLEVAVDHVADEKPAAAKACTGVVKGRS